MNEPKRRSPHLRVTAEQVRESWRQGDYTASGYLFHLIGALRKEGWQLLINDVNEFCKTWEISRASFYRAKARLICQGRLEEEVQGKLKLRIPRVLTFDRYGRLESDTECLESDTECLESDTECLESETECLKSETKTELEPIQGNGSGLPTDLFNSSTPVSQSPPPNNPERVLDEGRPSEQFRDWLAQRAARLPNPPALLSAWITSQAKNPDVQREFLNSLKVWEGETNVPPPVAAQKFSQDFSQEMTPDEHLEKWLTLWQTPLLRRFIAEQVEAHPEWGLCMLEDGPALAEEV